VTPRDRVSLCTPEKIDIKGVGRRRRPSLSSTGTEQRSRESSRERGQYRYQACQFECQAENRARQAQE
jgi:hypothetical protein